MSTIFVVVVILILLILLLRSYSNTAAKQVFGLKELRAALNIDSDISPRSLRAVVVGALGFTDRVVEDIVQEKEHINKVVESERRAVVNHHDDVEEIRREAAEKVRAINGQIAFKENTIKSRLSDLDSLEALEARVSQ